jgi:hypothetical protein
MRHDAMIVRDGSFAGLSAALRLFGLDPCGLKS